MRTLLELVEAATRTGERDLAEQAVAQLESVTRPIGNDWACAVLTMAQAQLHEGERAEALYLEAIERFERVEVPIMVGRCRLLYGEMLRRQHRRIDARVQLRAAHELLSTCGLNGFADRAARELSATGETLRVRTHASAEQLTDQERNVARLAREGLTNRDIGARLFISARTAEYHLRKVFMKLGIASRAELRTALAELDRGRAAGAHWGVDSAVPRTSRGRRCESLRRCSSPTTATCARAATGSASRRRPSSCSSTSSTSSPSRSSRT